MPLKELYAKVISCKKPPKSEETCRYGQGALTFAEASLFCDNKHMKVLVDNRKAYFNYSISDELTAGLVLSGAEVKSLKNGQASLKGAYVSMRGEEAFLTHAHISPYAKAGDSKGFNPERDRKLLLNKREIQSMIGKEKGVVIMPLQILEGGRGLIKLKIGIGRGKKKYDKRETIKKREAERRIRRAED